MLLKINLVDHRFGLKTRDCSLENVTFQSIGLWLNFIRVHFLLTLIDIFTKAALHWNVFYHVYNCRQATGKGEIFLLEQRNLRGSSSCGYISVARLRIYFMQRRASWLHLNRILSLLHSEECKTPGNSWVHNTGSQSSKGTKTAKLDVLRSGLFLLFSQAAHIHSHEGQVLSLLL